MLVAVVEILAGFVLLIWSADRLISGASAIALHQGVSSMAIGLIVIGFGTSAPEMMVSGIAAWHGNPGFAVGNALGSNITNIGLVLGLTALLRPLQVNSLTLRREIPVLFLIMAAALIMMADLRLSRWDGIMLCSGIALMLTWMVGIGIRSGGGDPMVSELEAEIRADVTLGKAMIWILIGLVVLPLSSTVLVDGAAEVASQLGVADEVIGLTILALGTSMPELAAALAAAWKDEPELAIGNVIGSNMFNLLGVLGIAATIAPLNLAVLILSRDSVIMVALTVAMAVFAFRRHGNGRLNRINGALLLSVYIGYIAVLIATA